MPLARRVYSLAPFAMLGLGEIAIFFSNPWHPFTEDSMYWIAVRHRSFGDFLAGFGQLDPSLWYRPLAQRAVESALYPLAGFNPLPYRVVGFALFYLCTLGVYLLAKNLSRSRRIAWFSVLLFAPHLINAFPTYDVSFTPELAYTLFSLISTLFFVQHLRTRTPETLAGSAGALIVALLCKESAAGLPFALLAIWFILPSEWPRSYRSLVPHFVILGLYAGFILGYLHVQKLGFAEILRGESVGSDYEFRAGMHIVENARNSLAWAFALPRDVHGYWNFEGHWMIPTLALLRVLAVAGAVAVLFTPRRRLLLIAAAWSLAMILPALPLVRHFLPYYLFAPLFGFALAMGTALDWLYEIGRKRLSSAAIAVPWAVLVLWILINASTARRLIREHPLLQKPTPAEAMHGLSLRPPTVPVVSFSALRIVSLP